MKIKSHERGRNSIRMTFKSLVILQKHTLNSHLILSTPKGLLTHKEAVKLKTGGFLVCTIL